MLDYYYTKKELKQLLNSLVVLIDTREQANEHIISYFDKHDIEHKERALSFCDYSFMLPKNEKLGIMRDCYYNSEFAIERKNSLQELSGNFTQTRSNFRNEMIRGKEAKIILLIEDSYSNLINGNYRTDFRAKSFLGSLLAWQHRYNLNINFIPKQLAGNFIFHELYYYLRELVK